MLFRFVVYCVLSFCILYSVTLLEFYWIGGCCCAALLDLFYLLISLILLCFVGCCFCFGCFWFGCLFGFVGLVVLPTI